VFRDSEELVDVAFVELLLELGSELECDADVDVNVEGGTTGGGMLCGSGTVWPTSTRRWLAELVMVSKKWRRDRREKEK
jgi:hypothetical protein